MHPSRPAEGSPCVLVTGAAGFIASHLIERLLLNGRPVVGLDNFDPFYPRALKESNLAHLRAVARATGTPFDFREGDFTVPADLAALPRNVDAVVHLGGKAGVRPSLLDGAGYIHANVVGTQLLLEWCRARRVETFVFGSSSSVYGNDSPLPFHEGAAADRPVSPYAATKRSAELLAASHAHLWGLKVTCLRFFTVYGPRQRPDLAIRKFTTRIAEGRPVELFGKGDTRRDYTCVSDIVSGILRALRFTAESAAGSFEIINLGGSRLTSLLELVRLLEANLGRAAQLVFTDEQPGDVRNTFADVGKARALLGYAPEIAIEDGIGEFVRWFRGEQVVAA